MNTDQMKFIFSSFIKSQFSYCLFISMFFTKRSLRRINNIHKWCLRLRQQNYIYEFERLLENANKKSVHQKCIEFLLIESLSSEKMPITLETFTHLNVKTSKKKKFSLYSITYRASQLWKNVPKEIKNSALLLIFKKINQQKSPFHFLFVSLL